MKLLTGLLGLQAANANNQCCEYIKVNGNSSLQSMNAIFKRRTDRTSETNTPKYERVNIYGEQDNTGQAWVSRERLDTFPQFQQQLTGQFWMMGGHEGTNEWSYFAMIEDSEYDCLEDAIRNKGQDTLCQSDAHGSGNCWGATISVENECATIQKKSLCTGEGQDPNKCKHGGDQSGECVDLWDTNSWECQCSDGYIFRDNSCFNDNECETGAHTCAAENCQDKIPDLE